MSSSYKPELDCVKLNLLTYYLQTRGDYITNVIDYVYLLTCSIRITNKQTHHYNRDYICPETSS